MQEILINHNEIDYQERLVPYHFIKDNLLDDQWQFNVPERTIQAILDGPGNPLYITAWREVISEAKYKHNGHEYRLYHVSEGLYITPIDDVQIMVSSAWGSQAYKYLFDCIKDHDRWNLGIDDDDKHALEAGPEHEWHWEAAHNLEMQARYRDEWGRPFMLYNDDGDIRLLPVGFTPEECW